jgi:hypothetical protein
MRKMRFCIVLAAIACLQPVAAQTAAPTPLQPPTVAQPATPPSLPVVTQVPPAAPVVTQPPASLSAPPPVVTVAQPLPTGPNPFVSLAPPADIASLTAKEILAANNAVVLQVATMYQHFGLLITVLVTVAAVFASYMSYVARKNVQEFVAEWDKKLQGKELQIDSTLQRARDAEQTAAKSATEAEKHANSLTAVLPVINMALTQVDLIRAQLDQIRERNSDLAANYSTPEGAAPQTPLAPTLTAPATQSAGPAIDEPISTHEQASVSERLRGRLPSEPAG